VESWLKQDGPQGQKATSGCDRGAMMPVGYSVRKAAQVIAFLIIEQGGKADLIKTIKLAYLSDRKFMELYDIPILNDDFYCLDNGPVDSMTYDYVKGHGAHRDEWERYIKPRNGNEIRIAKSADRLKLDELSEAEETVLRDTVSKYKHMRPFQLVDHVHQTCNEWTDPRGGSTHLTYENVFRAIGKRNFSQLAKHVDEMRHLSGTFSDQ
jgi:uncharacterized phage-associated protein